MDRPDLHYSSKEVCREMSRPVVGSVKRPQRIARELLTRPWEGWQFQCQELPSTFVVRVDANRAGRKRVRTTHPEEQPSGGRHLSENMVEDTTPCGEKLC